MSNNENKSITPLRKYIAIGYAVIALLIGGIVFIYLHEWRELERIEAEIQTGLGFIIRVVVNYSLGYAIIDLPLSQRCDKWQNSD